MEIKFKPAMSLVVVNRVALAGKSKLSPSTGATLPIQLALTLQLPLELPLQVLTGAAVVERLAKMETSQRHRPASDKHVFILRSKIPAAVHTSRDAEVVGTPGGQVVAVKIACA